jgi:hypothetical protein
MPEVVYSEHKALFNVGIHLNQYSKLIMKLFLYWHSFNIID